MAPRMGDVDASFAEALQRDASKIVRSDQGAEAYAPAQGGEVVSQDARRTAERSAKVRGQQLAFCRHLPGQAVEDEIEIQFAGNSEVEIFHGSLAEPFNYLRLRFITSCAQRQSSL